jgi:zinc transport system permease protein
MEIFNYDFMIRAFLAGTVIAVTAPLIGTYLVVRRYSLMADTLAHVSLLGVTIGFLLNIYPLLSAVIISVLSAILIEKIRRTKRIPGDALLAIFISGSLALAIILFNLMGGAGMNLFAFLFGSVATVSVSDLYLITILSFLIIIFLNYFKKDLFLSSLDEDIARVDGIQVSLLNYILVILTAICVSLSIKIIGTLLVGALIVIPVMTAINFKKGFYFTKNLSILISLFSVISGLFLSYYLGVPSGGAVVAVLLIFFSCSFLKNS